MKDQIQQAVKLGGAIIGKVIMYITIGLFINWIIAPLMVFNFGADTGFLDVIVYLLFLIVFPFLYYWLARRNAIRKGVQRFYGSSRGTIDSSIERVVGIVVNRAEQMGVTGNIGEVLTDMDGIVTQSTQGLPRAAQRIIVYFLEKIPFRDTLQKINANIDFTSGNTDVIKGQMLSKVDGFMNMGIMQEHKGWFIKLLGANIISIVIASYLF